MSSVDTAYALYEAVPELANLIKRSEQQHITVVLHSDGTRQFLDPWEVLISPTLMSNAPYPLKYHFIHAALSVPVTVLSAGPKDGLRLGLLEYDAVVALFVTDWYIRAYANGLVKEVYEDPNHAHVLELSEEDGVLRKRKRLPHEPQYLGIVYTDSKGKSWTRLKPRLN